ncbi:putative CRISPR-associated protein [Tautonia plasticadhaerens]|uniref:CRISPR-associated protein (Cas_APE2256) n=1 Tax=Tautonia plasticadhaerens TaxID=2527974 RepID=A0A518GYP4_9BACT|nr:putative CRISPR-associated protein [Tautonia plasticadhaerens]QDV33705.1 CRISPR-associated protein (Cas_APE2256) [Tautonia plasticadhaerens]
MRPATTLISTVGTSLFMPNLAGLRGDDPDPERRRLAVAYAARDWGAVASALASLPPTERTCGAEVNSIASLLTRGYAVPDANLFFCHSDTDDGRAIGRVLAAYYRRVGHPVAETRPIDGLQDSDPRRFRTEGLRNLAKVVCRLVRDYGPDACAINATGGYKAQIAVAVLLGQALGVPVYYKHERFDEIIAFPPMPVALDVRAWMRHSGLLALLDAEGRVPTSALAEDLDDGGEILECFVDRVEVDGEEYLALSPTGQVVHETFRERFRTERDRFLPPAVFASDKQPPKLGDHGVILRHREALRRYLAAITDDVPQVRSCRTVYCNPDLPRPLMFRLRGEEVQGTWSDGSDAVTFAVQSSATTDGQREAVVAILNDWLQARR